MATEAETLTFLALLLPFAGAAVAPVLTRFLGTMPPGRWRWFRAALCAFRRLPAARRRGWRSPPAPSPGCRAWASTSPGIIDGLSLTFALLISGIGTLIVLYSGRLPQGPSAPGPVLLLHADVHGRDAGAGARRQLPHAVRVLGTDLDHLVPADRLRQSRARRRAAPPSRRWWSPAWAGCRCWPACC